MSDIAIRVENLGKHYQIGQRVRYRTLRESLAKLFTRPFRPFQKKAGNSNNGPQSFWALQNVDFEIKQGDVVGVIGRNGAGKSTLLKVLSRITEPTSGRAEIRGRVGSLLEVGTGFHPELTGRENIFLNGAILGMRRAEVAAKLDEMVAFADIGPFLDTQVKHYSSGMYTRLAFAVAAHLESEILLVDEVLAVGDAQFQKKCLGKMRDLASREGRTVLFISHNMSAIQALCNQAIRLHEGTLVGMGNVEFQIKEYLSKERNPPVISPEHPYSLGKCLQLTCLRLKPDPVESGSPLDFELALASSRETTLHELALLIYSPLGLRVSILDFRSLGLPCHCGLGPKGVRITGQIHHLPLVEGDYQIGLYVNLGDTTGDFQDLVRLTVTGTPTTSTFAPYSPVYRGFFNLDFAAQVIQDA